MEAPVEASSVRTQGKPGRDVYTEYRGDGVTAGSEKAEVIAGFYLEDYLGDKLWILLRVTRVMRQILSLTVLHNGPGGISLSTFLISARQFEASEFISMFSITSWGHRD